MQYRDYSYNNWLQILAHMIAQRHMKGQLNNSKTPECDAVLESLHDKNNSELKGTNSDNGNK